MSYKCIFFDWDGTAVESRTACAQTVLKTMEPLLLRGVKLIIVSGTTYENIAGGELHLMLTEECLKNLYLGLGRGAYNYGFDNGTPTILKHEIPRKSTLLDVHKASFDLHLELMEKYDLCTDIVFNRPNYCKLDLMANHDRDGKLFLQQSEITMVESLLKKKGFTRGLSEVLELAESFGEKYNLDLCATTDAKYIELGTTTKSNNVDYFMNEVVKNNGMSAQDCCFVGDEFTYVATDVIGSDAYMITDMTRGGDFYDVSESPWKLPAQVKHIGGGTEGFNKFLLSQ